MTAIDTTTSTVTLRTDLGADATTEQLRAICDATLTLVQYVADSLTTYRDRKIQVDPDATDRSASALDLDDVRDLALDLALDLAEDLARQIMGLEGMRELEGMPGEDYRSLLAVGRTVVLDLAEALATGHDFEAASHSSRRLRRDLGRAIGAAAALPSDPPREAFVGLTFDRVFALYTALTSTLDLGLVLAPGYDRVLVAAASNRLGAALSEIERIDTDQVINDAFQRLDEDYNAIVDRLVSTGPFVETPVYFSGVVGLSYRNPFDVVIDTHTLLLGMSGSLSVGGVIAVLRILFGSGPGERAEAGRTTAETIRIELENEERRKRIEAIVERTVPPFDKRVGNAVSAVQVYDWAIERD